jgi:hypothetical protein
MKQMKRNLRKNLNPTLGGHVTYMGGGRLINKQIPGHVANLASPASRKILHIKANFSQERNLLQHHQNRNQD